MTLYELSREYRELLDAIEADAIPTEAIADTLEGMDGAWTDKAEAVACFIKELEADAAAIKAEAKRLMERAQKKESKAESMRDYLIFAMKSAGKTSVETTRVAISVPKPRCTVSLTGCFVEWARQMGREDLLTYEEPKPSKTAIKAALEDGMECPHAAIVPGRETVRIK